MDIQAFLFAFFGGLALFLFGLNFMSDGLKDIGNNAFRKILQVLTKNKFKAILVGMGITCLIQSSSATSVIVVGFVNAGLLALKQAVAVVLGAEIGTTFTAWIVSIMGKFKMDHYALPIIAVGTFIYFFPKKRKAKMLGQSLLGFGFLFLGLGIMSGALKPLKESEYLKDLFIAFGKNPLLGILAGAIITCIIQSSSATIAIIQVMAFQGLLSFEAALPIICGCNIGTTITAQLAAITGTRNSRSTAMAHSFFNIFGTLFILPLLLTGWYEQLIKFIVPGALQASNVMFHIAVAHSIFNISNVLIFSLLFWPLLLKVAQYLSYGKDVEIDIQKDTIYLDPLLLTDPPIAMNETILELVHMTEIAKSAVQDAEMAILNKDMHRCEIAKKKEDILDEFQRKITSYLIQISEKDLDTKESMEYPVLLHSVNDIEKVGDYVKNLANYAEIRYKNEFKFSKTSIDGIKSMFQKLYELFDNVILSLEERDNKKAYKAIKIEDEIDKMKIKRRSNYIKSLHAHKTNPESEMMAMDIATNIEKIGDHLISIAKAVLKDLQWGKKMGF